MPMSKGLSKHVKGFMVFAYYETSFLPVDFIECVRLFSVTPRHVYIYRYVCDRLRVYRFAVTFGRRLLLLLFRKVIYSVLSTYVYKYNRLYKSLLYL